MKRKILLTCPHCGDEVEVTVENRQKLCITPRIIMHVIRRRFADVATLKVIEEPDEVSRQY